MRRATGSRKAAATRSIVLTEIPYQVGKSGLVEKIAEAAKDKRIEGVADIRDKSNREGVRIVIELKRDATPDVVLNQLWRHTPAQSSFPANMLAIRGGRPETLKLRDIIEAFVRFRERSSPAAPSTNCQGPGAGAILLGLVIAVTNLDEMVRIIRGSASPPGARGLLAREWPIAEIAPYIEAGRSGRAEVRRRDLSAVRNSGPRDPRAPAAPPDRARPRRDRRRARRACRRSSGAARDPGRPRTALRGHARGNRRVEASSRPRAVTEIAAAADGIEDEDLIEREEMVVTVTMEGYIKRTTLGTFRAQNRGGKGRAGMATKDEDAITELFVTSTHTPVLFFSNAGKVYRLKVWRLPEGGPNTRGPADGQPAAAGARARRSRPCCRCLRTRRNGRTARHVRDRPRHRPPQQDGRVHQRSVERQDRDALRSEEEGSEDGGDRPTA